MVVSWLQFLVEPPRNSVDFPQCKEFSPGDIEINGSSRKFHSKSFHRPQFANAFQFNPVSMLTQWWLSVRKSKCLCIDACINAAPQKICYVAQSIYIWNLHIKQTVAVTTNRNVLEKQSISWKKNINLAYKNTVSHFLQEQLVERQTITNMHGVTQHLIHLGWGDFSLSNDALRERYDDAACLWTGGVWSAAIIHCGCSTYHRLERNRSLYKNQGAAFS